MERRRCFIVLRRCFCAMRRSLLARVGFVAIRGVRGAMAFSTRRSSRSIAVSRFWCCDRVSLACTTISPARFMRLRSAWRIIAFSVSENASERLTSHVSCTFVAVLLTCCPPGPAARTYTRRSSCNGILPCVSIYGVLYTDENRMGRFRPIGHYCPRAKYRLLCEKNTTPVDVSTRGGGVTRFLHRSHFR